MRLIFATATVLAANLSAAAACADQAIDAPVTEAVSFADLDLTSKSDRTTLQRRVRYTIGSLCPGDDGASPAPPFPESGCVRAKLKDARVQMDRAFARAERHPMLAAAPSGKSAR